MHKRNMVERVTRDARLIDVHTHVGMNPARYRLGDFPYAQSAEDLLIRLQRWGVDVAACFPVSYSVWFDPEAFGQGRMLPNPTPECPAPFVWENQNLCREIYEAYSACAGRLLPFLFFDPAREQRGQVDAMAGIAERYPVFGLKTVTSYMQSHITDLLEGGACLLDFAAARNLPLVIHSAIVPSDPWANVHAVLRVVRTRPELRFCIAHTCKFDRRALDEAAELPNCFVDFSAFNIHCQLACEHHPTMASQADRFPADYRNHAEAMAAIAEAYPDTMLWGTDTPYYCFKSRFVSDAGETVFFNLHCDTDTEILEFRKMPELVRRQVGRDNTLRYLFGE